MADAVFTFGADTAELMKGLKGISSGVDTLANSFSGKMARIGQAFSGVKEIAGTVAQYVGKAISATLEPAQKVEEAATRLGLQMQDMAGGKMLADMLNLDSANGTKSLEDLTAAAGKLSSSFSDIGELREWVNVLGDISEGARVPMDTLIGAIAKAEATGTAALRSVNPLIAAEIPIIQALGKQMGMTGDEVMDAMSRGAVSAEQFKRALKSTTEEGGKYHKMMSTLSNTGKGSVETMWASLGIVLGKVGAVFNEALKPVVQAVGSWLQDVAPKVESVMQAMAREVEPVQAALMEFGAGLWEVVKQVGLFIGEVMKCPVAVAAWKMHLKDLEVILKVVAGALKGLGKVMELLGQAANAVLGSFLTDEALDKLDAARKAAQMLSHEQAKAAKVSADDEDDDIVARQLARVNRVRYESTKALKTQASAGGAAADALDGEATAASGAARAQEELAEKRREAARAAGDYVSAAQLRRRERDEEKLWDSMSPQDAIDSILGTTTGLRSLEDVQRRMEEIRAAGEHTLPEELGEYKELERVERLILKHQERQVKLVEERGKALAQVRAEEGRYADEQWQRGVERLDLVSRERSLRAELAGLGVQEAGKIGDRIAELAKADAAGNAAEIERLRTLRDMWGELVERKTEYARTRAEGLMGLRADVLDAQGRDDEARRAREELLVAQRIEELKNEGASAREAREIALMESQVRTMRQQQSLAEQTMTRIGTSGSSYGNGYSARLFGGDQLSETKKGNELLNRIERRLERIERGQGGGKVVAVLG